MGILTTILLTNSFGCTFTPEISKQAREKENQINTLVSKNREILMRYAGNFLFIPKSIRKKVKPAIQQSAHCGSSILENKFQNIFCISIDDLTNNPSLYQNTTLTMHPSIFLVSVIYGKLVGDFLPTSTLQCSLLSLVSSTRILQGCRVKNGTITPSTVPAQVTKLCHLIEIDIYGKNYFTYLNIIGYHRYGSNFTFHKLDSIFSNNLCNIDKVSVYDIYNRSLGTYCGKMMPWSLFSFHHKMTLYVNIISKSNFVFIAQFQIIPNYQFLSMSNSPFGILMKDFGNENFIDHQLHVFKTLSLAHPMLYVKGICYYHWTWRGIPGSLSYIRIDKMHDYLHNKMFLHGGMFDAWNSEQRNMNAVLMTYKISEDSKFEFYKAWNFIVGIRLEIELAKLRLFFAKDIQFVFGSIMDEDDIQSIEKIRQNVGPENINGQFMISDEINEVYYGLFRYRGFMSHDDSYAVARTLSGGLLQLNSIVVKQNHYRLFVNITQIQYAQESCPVFGIYIYDGDFERRKQYYYLMGPYCGQTSYPDSSLFNITLTTRTHNLTIVIYSFHHESDIHFHGKVEVLEGHAFYGLINPCTTAVIYCSQHYWHTRYEP